MTDTILNYIILLLITAVTGIISSVLLPALSKWLCSKTENVQIQTLISDITTTVATSVNMMEQKSVCQYKADNNWNKKTQQIVLQDAVNDVISNLLETTKQSIKDNNIDIQKLIERHIESYIRSKKEF